MYKKTILYFVTLLCFAPGCTTGSADVEGEQRESQSPEPLVETEKQDKTSYEEQRLDFKRLLQEEKGEWSEGTQLFAYIVWADGLEEEWDCRCNEALRSGERTAGACFMTGARPQPWLVEAVECFEENSYLYKIPDHADLATLLDCIPEIVEEVDACLHLMFSEDEKQCNAASEEAMISCFEKELPALDTCLSEPGAQASMSWLKATEKYLVDEGHCDF